METDDPTLDPSLAGGRVQPGRTDPDAARRATPPDPAAVPEPRRDAWLSDARARVEAQVRAHPYASVLAAAGAGYVLGAGIPRWAVRGLVSAGVRVAIGQAIATAVSPAQPDNPNPNPNPNPGVSQ